MKILSKLSMRLISASIALGLAFTISACGQKGPLIVEEPALEAPKTQDEELAPTK